jgi:gentisate 1,2-dioxygenase
MSPGETIDEQAIFHDRIGAQNLAALWVGRRGVDLSKPKSPAVAFRWHYDGLRDDLAEAGDIVTAEEAFRRVLVLENPSFPGNAGDQYALCRPAARLAGRNRALSPP